MKRRFGLQAKITLIFLGVMAAITVSVLIVMDYNNQVIIEERFYDYAVGIGSLTAGMVTAQEVLDYQEQLSSTPETVELPPEYYSDLKRLETIQSHTNIQYLYVIYPVTQTEGIYIYDVADQEEEGSIPLERTHLPGEAVDLKDGFHMAIQAMEQGKAGDRFEYEVNFDFESGEAVGSEPVSGLVSAFVPILDQDGRAVAFVGVDMRLTDILGSIKTARRLMLGSMLILMLICYGVLMRIIRRIIVKPIHTLKLRVDQMSDGSFGEEVPVRGHDEISEITRAFNRMASGIQRNVKEIQAMNHAYHKHVPFQLLDILGKENITEVEVGDQASRFVTVLSFQLTERREYIRKQNSRGIMESMNQLFQTIIPVVVQQQGFVQSFRDTGMIAIYTGGAKGALMSALSICEAMNHMSKYNKTTPPEISMGIAYGGVLFGIVGHESRMSAVSISAHTVMAEYLQRLAPLYGAKLLITAGAVGQLPDFAKSYHYRFAGLIENEYSGTVEKIYDVYDSDSEEQRSGKERTREEFEKGVELFCMGRFRESRQAFIEVLKRFRKDQGAKRYLQFCNQYDSDMEDGDVTIFMCEGAPERSRNSQAGSGFKDNSRQ